MKRIMIVSAAVIAVLLTGLVIVRAETRGSHGWCGRPWHHAGPASYLAHQLKLTEAQRAQIRNLWQTDQPAVSADLQELLTDDKQLNAIAASGHPDPGAVQQAADREARTIAALLVEKARLQSTIETTVLNPEQRAKAEELQKKWESRLDRAANRLENQPPKQ